MKTRLIAAAAALMLTVTSLVSLAGAETVNPDSAALNVPAVVTEVTTETEKAAETATAPEETAQVEEKAAETVKAPVVAANVKTHHKYTTVANQFQVKVGHVSKLTKVCLWSTDCRKACTKIRRLSADETLTVVAQSNGWYKVVDANGRTGFVVRSRVTKA